MLDALHDSGAPRLTTVELDTGGDVIVRTIKDRHGVDHLLAPRRIVLDDLLLDAARRAGARIETGVERRPTCCGTAADGSWGSGPMTPVAASGCGARHVVGADGLGSRVARSVGAPLDPHATDLGRGLYAYFAGDWSGNRVPRRRRRPRRRLPDPRG